MLSELRAGSDEIQLKLYRKISIIDFNKIIFYYLKSFCSQVWWDSIKVYEKFLKSSPIKWNSKIQKSEPLSMLRVNASFWKKLAAKSDESQIKFSKNLRSRAQKIEFDCSKNFRRFLIILYSTFWNFCAVRSNKIRFEFLKTFSGQVWWDSNWIWWNWVLDVKNPSSRIW